MRKLNECIEFNRIGTIQNLRKMWENVIIIIFLYLNILDILKNMLDCVKTFQICQDFLHFDNYLYFDNFRIFLKALLI